MGIQIGIDRIQGNLQRYGSMVSTVYNKSCDEHGAIFGGSFLVKNSSMAVFYTVYVVPCLLDLSLMKI